MRRLILSGAALCVAILLLGALSVSGSYISYLHPLLDVGRRLLNLVPQGILDHIAAVVLLSLISFNYRAILRFLRESLKPTDGQIVGNWFVSRFIVKHGAHSILTERWKIARGLSSRYIVIMYQDAKKYMNFSGIVAYNERDRLNLLISGLDHHQQSLVCFETNIPRSDDSRMLGLGVGDDYNYFLTTRIYFASRTQYSNAYIEHILLEATSALRSDHSATPLLRLNPEVIANVLGKYPPCVSDQKDSEIRGAPRSGMA
jgi:hypothetical protein